MTVRMRRSIRTPPTPATEMSANLWSTLTSATTGRVSSRRGRSVRYTTNVFLFGGRIDRVDDIGEIGLLVRQVRFAAHTGRPPALGPVRALQAFRQVVGDAFGKSRWFARIRDQQHRNLLTRGTGVPRPQMLVRRHRLRVPARCVPKLQAVGASRSQRPPRISAASPCPVDTPQRLRMHRGHDHNPRDLVRSVHPADRSIRGKRANDWASISLRDSDRAEDSDKFAGIRH